MGAGCCVKSLDVSTEEAEVSRGWDRRVDRGSLPWHDDYSTDKVNEAVSSLESQGCQRYLSEIRFSRGPSRPHSLTSFLRCQRHEGDHQDAPAQPQLFYFSPQWEKLWAGDSIEWLGSLEPASVDLIFSPIRPTISAKQTGTSLNHTTRTSNGRCVGSSSPRGS